MNTKGLITIPNSQPNSKDTWFYELHNGNISLSNGIILGYLFEYEKGSAGVSEPGVVVTNVFCEEIN